MALLRRGLKQALKMYSNGCYHAGIQSHGARYAFARERMQAYREQGYSEREARSATSLDLGHGDGRGRYIASVYVRANLATIPVATFRSKRRQGQNTYPFAHVPRLHAVRQRLQKFWPPSLDVAAISNSNTAGGAIRTTMAKQPPKGEGKKLRLTVFLIKEDYEEIGDFLEVGKLQKISVNKAGALGTLFFRSGFSSMPPWAPIFDDVPGFSSSSIVNRSSRALYVVKERGRWFCFTFGYTRHLLNDAAVERNFGLIVSLNLGDPSAIKAIDKTNISHIGLQSREQAGRDVGLESFEFDTDIDLLKSMTTKGPEKDGEEQETYSGRDSITVYTRVSLDAFADIAKKLYKAFQSTTYRKLYPWIDKISQERDPTIIAALDAALVAAINSGETAKIWMAVPEIISWEEVENFAYKIPSGGAKKAGPALYPDIDLDSWLVESGLQGAVTLNHLNHRKVFQCYKDGREPTRWSIYRCLNAEIDLGKQKYVLNDGDWYAVDREYVKEVDDFYRTIPTAALSLPHYGTKTEPTYLSRIPKTHPQYVVMDRRTVMIGGGRNRIEFCDLYSRTRDIIHVKQYGGSSLLSHLFSQALVSAECFLHEAGFRQEVNKLLPEGFKIKNPDADPTPTDYTVCLAIMSKVAGPLEIPFFSKVSLKHAVRSLRRMNFNVTLLKIDR